MKMPADTFEALRDLFRINALLDPDQSVYRSYRQAGLSARRYRWDRFWNLPSPDRTRWFDHFLVYRDLNDTHIDTALKAIFPHAKD